MFLCLHILFTNLFEYQRHFKNQTHTQCSEVIELTFARSSFVLCERIPGAALTAKTTKTQLFSRLRVKLG